MSDDQKISFHDLAVALSIKAKNLSYIAFVLSDDHKYTHFTIPKKSGGKRKISKPVPKLLHVQRKLKDFLLTFYSPKSCSHGFEFNKSIKSNASNHIKSKVLLNIDIEDFFGSINFGRVYGLLLRNPFNFEKKAAAAVASIVTYKNKLPQGAPTSPLISNMIARRLDSSLTALASRNRAVYTRYVDDITISTTRRSLNKSIVLYGDLETVNLGEELKSIFRKEGFDINQSKTRLLSNFVRKEVTGITINEFPNVPRKYINSIFGMIHSWKKYGYNEALANFRNKHRKAGRLYSKEDTLFRSVVIGRINYVASIRGWDDVVVNKLCRKYCECDENPPGRIGTIGSLSMKYDVFLGHASEQKEKVVIPLYEALLARRVKAFIDIVDIQWGDSLTRLINRGLTEADYFVAIISADSINKSWPDAEINSAIAREIDGKQKVLPLFVGSKNDIERCKDRYPLIADKLYKVWEDNPDDIAAEIQQLISGGEPVLHQTSETLWTKIKTSLRSIFNK